MTTGDYTEAELAAMRAQLQYSRRSMTYWRGQETAAENEAAEMREVARGLEREVNPLRTAFSPIRQLHTVSTWEGAAATASRSRLDQHEARCTTAVRQIDGLVDDLEEAARQADTRADSASSAYNSARWQVAQLERDLGYYDHI